MSFLPRSFDKKPKEEIDRKFRLKSHFKDLWTVLHVSSVYLPEKLNEGEENEYKGFVEGLLHFATKADEDTNKWASDYRQSHKYNFSSRENAALWLCKLHNSYNLKNNKYLFECNMENLTQRYGNNSALSQKSPTSSL
jgi:hypothetical protein